MGALQLAGLVAGGAAFVATLAGVLVHRWRKRRAARALEAAGRAAFDAQLDAQAQARARDQERLEHRELAKKHADEAARRDGAGGLGAQLRDELRQPAAPRSGASRAPVARRRP